MSELTCILALASPTLWTAVTVAYFAAIIAVAVIIIADNGNPTRSLAWVTVVVLLPVVGVVLYVFLGRGLKGVRTVSRRKRRKLLRAEQQVPLPKFDGRLDDMSRQLVKLGHTTADARFYPDTEVAVFSDGKSFFDALIADMRAATTYINIQYYIFADDNIGTTIADLLVEKAREGVRVRLCYDYVGCIDVPEAFFNRMIENGVEVEPFFKVAFPKFALTLNWRNHRKGVIIDGKIGYIGGMNVADRYITGGDSFGRWRDTSVRISGAAVAGMQYSFAVDWSFMGRELLDDEVSDIPDCYPGATDGVGVQVITGGPTERYSGIALTFFKAIAMARKRVFIQTPYFLPNTPMLNALQAAAIAGADVRVMMPRQTDSKILAYASRSYIDECLGAGIRFYFYEPGMLHAKVLITDDEFSSVGSANFDYRSFEHNFEENIMMYSKEMNELMVSEFERDMADCTRVVPKEWYRRRPLEKLRESLCRLLSPLL